MPSKISGPVRVAMIGAGGISGAHVKGFTTYNDKLRVTALCDVDPLALKRRSESLGGVTRQYSDWNVMLKEMDGEIDAVDICLPHHLHGPAILDAAAAGKHILCEKPMCISLAEADAIAAALKNAGVTYMSAHNQLFMPAVQEAKRMIDAGELGQIIHIRSQDCFMATRSRKDWNWRADFATQGGGELIDTGYHPSYRLIHLAGSTVEAVRGTYGRFRHDIDGEDTASVQVRFANGIIGEVFTSWAMNNPWGTHQIHITGEKGQLFGSENTLYFLPAGYSEPAKRTFPSVDTFEAELGHFADCLQKGTRPIHGVEEGRAVLELILKAAESAAGWEKTAVKNLK
jgi:predicted dehydrogenase